MWERTHCAGRCQDIIKKLRQNGRNADRERLSSQSLGT